MSQLTRRRCDNCKSHVAKSWYARHVASACRVAPGSAPPEPRFWLRSDLRLRPLATLDRWDVRRLGTRKKRRWEPM